MHLRNALLLLSLLCFASFAPPESPANYKLRYKIVKDGKTVGEIVANQTVQGEQVTYEVDTRMDIRVLVSQKINYSSRAVYQNNTLQSASSKSFVNEKLHGSCVTMLKGNKYWIKSDKGEFTLARAIGYSGVMLYFREPGSNNFVYSEMSGQDNTVKKVAVGQYVLTNTRSKKQNRYWYKGGILDHATINHTLMDLEIQRVN